ncbi:MAG TPA: TonB-dependent receptor [Sphingobacterium sp.]|nr:TonB-dependent receptor [Sphingobacterium sp.]
MSNVYNFKYIWIFLLPFLLSSNLFSQVKHKQIEGLVLDTAGYSIKGVSVRLTSTKDTLITVTNNAGAYFFKAVDGTNIQLTFNLLGHSIKQRFVTHQNEQTKIFVPDVVMIPRSSLLREVNVNKIIPVIYKQDTIQYNLSAFSFRKNELLEESLKQLPGIQVSRNGSVFSGGQRIMGVRVDGKKFFGGDVLTATRNLPTDFISKIQIIDQYTEEGISKGVEDNSSEKIINILLKEDKKKIFFGQLTAGGGTAERYMGSIGANRFNDGEELSIVASTNNTNTSLFSFGSPNGLGGRTSNLEDISDFSDPIDGLNKISSLGVNFSDKVGKRSSISGGYSYTLKESYIEGFSKQTSEYIGNRISSSDDFETKSKDKVHKVKFELNAILKNKDVLKISPAFTYKKSHVYDSKNRFLRNKQLTNEGNYQDTIFSQTPDLDTRVLYSKNFSKPQRRLVAVADFKISNFDKNEKVSDFYLEIDSSKATPEVSEFNQRQLVEAVNNSKSIQVKTTYTEPFFEHSLLEITHEYEYTITSAQRRVADRTLGAAVGEPVFIDSLGMDYQYLFQSNRTGLNYQYAPNNRFKTNIGFAVKPLVMTGEQLLDSVDNKYESVSLIPTAGIHYKFDGDIDWRIYYQGNNNQPDFMHIMPMIDNSNSRYIIVGNPELKAEFTHKINTTFQKIIPKRSQYIEANFAYNFANNKIVNAKRLVENSTVQETTFKNAKGYYELRGYYVFNTPLFKNDDLQLDIHGNVDYINGISYINEEKNRTKQIQISQNTEVRYNWSTYFESVFNANYIMHNAEYNLPFTYKIRSNSFSLSAGAKSYLSDHLSVGLEMSQRIQNGFNKEIMQVNPSIINAYLEFSFLKNKLALFRLQGFDLLDENKNMGIYNEYIGNDIYESRNNRLGRYFMLTLNIRMQRAPK